MINDQPADNFALTPPPAALTVHASVLNVESPAAVYLIRICADDATPAGVRDAAIIALLRGTGLRRSEAVALDLADYDRTTGALTIRSGKGKKERLTYVAVGAKAALDEWLIARGRCRPAILWDH